LEWKTLLVLLMNQGLGRKIRSVLLTSQRLGRKIQPVLLSSQGSWKVVALERSFEERPLKYLDLLSSVDIQVLSLLVMLAQSLLGEQVLKFLEERNLLVEEEQNLSAVREALSLPVEQGLIHHHMRRLRVMHRHSQPVAPEEKA
jgi:hypothetical protein